MDKDHLSSVQEKCDYCSANCAALGSGKLRHEIVGDGDGNVDEDPNKTSMTNLLHLIGKENENAVRYLESRGYELANTLRCTINRTGFDQEQSQSRSKITTPGTTEHQQRLAKASTQGSHFYATNGGGPTNYNECLIEMEMKFWDDEKKFCKGRAQNTSTG